MLAGKRREKEPCGAAFPAAGAKGGAGGPARPLRGRDHPALLPRRGGRAARSDPQVDGGRVDAALRRAAELTDGWIGGPFSPAEDYRASLATVHEYAKGFGRDPADLEAGKLIYVSVDDDKERALATLNLFIADYYGPRIDIAEQGVYGPPDQVAAQLRGFVDAGVTTFMLGVPTLDIGHIERIAKEVVPKLQD